MNQSHNYYRIRCECNDPGCKVHLGSNVCDRHSWRLLFRIDMEDENGTAFCTSCGEDAFESGLFE